MSYLTKYKTGSTLPIISMQINSRPHIAHTQMSKQPSGHKMSGFSLMTEDIMKNILYRLPAPAFACASCVNKYWYRVCSRILRTPRVASAVSLNPSPCDAVEEVIDEVLSEPIRPHFAITCVSKEFDLELTHRLIVEKLGSNIPIITNVANGIIGFEAITDELLEEKWETTNSSSNSQESNTTGQGLVLLIGYLPGLKIGTIPLLQHRQESNPLVDQFVMDILQYTTAVSDCAAPTGIMLFGDKYIDLKPVVTKLDCAMPEETVIVGDASGTFMCRSGDNSLYNLSHYYSFHAVALVFARDRYKPQGLGEIQFHTAKSTGVIPFGPKLEAVCVATMGSVCSWIAARLEGQNDILDCRAILSDIEAQFTDDRMSADLFIGVTKKCTHVSEISTPGKSLDFYTVTGGGDCYITVKGVGIKPGDSFLFYHSDPETASASCDHVFNRLLNLKDELKSKNYLRLSDLAEKADKREVIGGFIFSSYLRGESFFGEPFIDSNPFFENFPAAPIAGIFCRGEIGRGPRSLMSEEYEDENSPRSCLHVCSTIYLVMSYLPPPLEDSEIIQA